MSAKESNSTAANKKKLGILLLGGARRVSVGRMFIHAARSLDCEAKLYSYELSSDLPISEIAHIVIGLRWNDPGILDHISQIIHKYDIKIVIPFVDPAVAIAAQIAHKLPHVFAPCCSAQLAEILFDKTLADELFAKIDMPRPLISHSYSGKVIAKPRHGSASKGIRVFEDLHIATSTLQAEKSIESYLLQCFVENAKEVTVDCYVASDGRICVVSPRLRIETIGGEVTSTMTIHNVDIEALSRKFLRASEIKGAVTIQFLIAPDGEVMIMEVNPRLGGGVVCTVHAGADIPLLILKDALAISLSEIAPKPDVKIVRYLQEVVVH